jgi:membrane associated rhomboid family serine protease
MMLTYLIIAFTCLVSIPAFGNRTMFGKMVFNPSIIKENNEWYRFLTHALLHADFIHLAVNMYVLFSFGTMVERDFVLDFGPVRGEIYFFLLYLISIPASSVASYEKHKDDYSYNAVGASGAVSAVLFAAIFLEPTGKYSLMFPPIRNIPAPIFGALYLAYCVYAEKHAKDNVAHGVHYWGAIFGIVFTLVVLPESFFSFIDAVKHIF